MSEMPNAESDALRIVRLIEQDMAEQAISAWRSADARRGLSDHEALMVHADALTRWSERLRMALKLPCACPSRGDAERAERRYEALVEALRAAYPRYNCELRPDGSEDPQMSAYADAWREVDQIIEQTLRAAPSECPMVTVKATQCPYDACWRAGRCQAVAESS